MKLQFTEAQLNALMALVDDVEGMIGGGDAGTDAIWSRHVDALDRMLKKNGLSRDGRVQSADVFQVEDIADGE